MVTPLTCGIHHLGLSVSNLKIAQDFFVNALNFTILGENSDYPSAFLTDTVNTVTLWQTNENATEFDRRNHIGLHHVAFLINSQDQLEILYKRLTNWQNVAMEGGISPPSPESKAHHFFIRMPGGPRIEFYAPQNEVN